MKLLSDEEIQAIEEVILSGDHADVFITKAGIRINRVKKSAVEVFYTEKENIEILNDTIK